MMTLFVKESITTTLFEDIARSNTGPKTADQSAFNYYNTSARPRIGLIRSLLENWFSRYPEDGRADLCGRFRSPLDSHHHGAFFELYLHELLTRMGFSLSLHPEGDGRGGRPDFLVFKEGRPTFYLEATVVADSVANAGASARMASVIAGLEKLDSPNFYLWISESGAPSSQPSHRKLRADLKKWLDSLDVDVLSQLMGRSGMEAMPHFVWAHEGWRLTFRPIPKSPDRRGQPGIMPIGLRMGDEAKMVISHELLRTKIKDKGSKYGDLELPFVVAVNLLEDFSNDESIMEGLFGDETVEVSYMGTKVMGTVPGRRPNGAWTSPEGPRGRSVSAALVAVRLMPWSLKSCTPMLFHHPWAMRPISRDTWPLPQRYPDFEASTMALAEGEHAHAYSDLTCFPNCDPMDGI